MPGLLTDVTKTADAMKAYGKVFEVKGNNISQVNNPNYAKQTVRIQSKGTYRTDMGPESFGVGVTEITDARNKILDTQIMKEKMNRGSLDGQQDLGTSLESFFDVEVEGLGKTQDSAFSGGFGKTLTSYFAAFDGLSAQPNDNSQKTTVFNNAKMLVEELNGYAAKFQTIEDDLVTQANMDIEEVNRILEKIGSLNTQITRLEVGTTQKSLENRNERQGALEELAQYMNFTVENHPDTTGSIIIKTKDTGSSDVTLLDHNSIINPVVFDGTDVRTVSGSPVTLGLTGGRLYGYMNFRDTTLADTKTRMDALANQLVTAVNAAYNPTSSTGDFFDATGLSAATIALDGALTVTSLKSTDTSNAGANELALAVANLSDKQFSTGGGDVIDGTMSAHFSTSVGNVGSEVKTIKQKILNQTTLELSLMNRRDSEISVSLDEEVADLLVFQKGYTALSGYLKLIDRLLDDVLKQIG